MTFDSYYITLTAIYFYNSVTILALSNSHQIHISVHLHLALQPTIPLTNTERYDIFADTYVYIFFCDNNEFYVKNFLFLVKLIIFSLFSPKLI